VRWTLIGAGLLAVVGAVLVGLSLSRALDAEDDLPAPLSLTGASTPPEVSGLFVTFEGGDGAGKSTQIRLLRSALERSGRTVVVTREPGGTRLGEEIRELLLRRAAEEPTSRTEALLYAAARAQHVEEVILPALRRGSVVICDRFVDSSVAYQGAGRGLGEESIDELNRWATGVLRPDLIVLLDVDPGAGLDRAARDGDADRIETAGLDFHRRTRAAFLGRADADPDRYLVLDARRPIEELHAEIRSRVADRLPPPPPPPATGAAGASSGTGVRPEGAAAGPESAAPETGPATNTAPSPASDPQSNPASHPETAAERRT
jgi:dTMP kinase